MATVVITGVSGGLGLALAQIYLARGETVIGTVRRAAPEVDALGIRVEHLDHTDDASATALAARLSDTKIDLLIHTVGLLQRVGLDALDLASIRAQFEINALGPLAVTAALLPRLAPGAKVAVLTSRMGSIGDNTSGGHYGYRMGKAALNAACKSLALDLAPRGIAVGILHPGFVRTRMTRGAGDWDPPEAAAALVERIDELSVENTGRFLHARGQELPW